MEGRASLQHLLWPVTSYIDKMPGQIRKPLDEVLGRAQPPAVIDVLACRHSVLHLLEMLAESRPLLLVLDDAHLIDRDSLDLVVYAVRRVAGPMATLCSARGHRIPDGVSPGMAAVALRPARDHSSG